MLFGLLVIKWIIQKSVLKECTLIHELEKKNPQKKLWEGVYRK